ncbi:DUF1134 domain-containing protein [Sphingomonas immobilis]|uniref:EipA family protein n=1 Tax=Sphingomonas immobilis TaxID=3063997 RepID=A0ABT9A1Q6_9SPHN|nr:EipA family protein [Sphingomonas sp. CA1-15]MDO7843762.1 EipA family protein [Sphingomonas sp. CA1-15]
MRTHLVRFSLIGAALAVVAAPLIAQVRTIDPNQAIDSDLRRPAPTYPTPNYPAPTPQPPASDVPRYGDPVPAETNTSVTPGPYNPQSSATPVPYADSNQPQGYRTEAEIAAGTADTFKREELLRAAEGTFGRGAAGLSGILERTLKEQGEPNAYIAGSEGAGAVVVGLRYGRGRMFHKIEGEMPIYWTGPSVGFDLGGDANKVFVLVYNLYDTEEAYRRFPAGEGRIYFVGGFAATYLRRGNIVMIPIRLGVGWRQGVNIGYMKFSHKSRWFPL